MKRRKGMRQQSMKWGMMGILLVCWLIPFSFMIGVLGVYIANNHSDMTAQNFQKQLEFNDRICVDRLDAAIAASRDASYDGELLSVYERYREGQISKAAAEKSYNQYLISKYQKDDAVSSAFLWFCGEEEDLYQIYNERAGATYQQVRSFQASDYETVKEYAGELGTRVGFLCRDGKLYLVRNLMDHRYTQQAVLVLRINQAYCFSGLTDYPSADGIRLRINQEELLLLDSEALEGWLEKYGEEPDGDGYMWSKERLYVTDVQSGDSYTLCTTMVLRREITRFPFYGYQYVVGGMVAILIPMLFLVFYAFRKQVTEPVEQLSAGAVHIEKGELGYQIKEIPRNLEFAYLSNAFNEMSGHLKRQFDRIYEEEIALREARIMALQSHINPHFMNNTLEIINWEARMSGNEKVSHMIEALSTMMDAALDRRRRPEVRLAEEMQYVNSYLYITKERLGKRLTVVCDIAEELKDYLVPRLILQPVVENAVEHGIVPNGSGIVEIHGFRDEKFLYLQVVNDGGLSATDKERIRRLLAPDYNNKNEPSSNLGIMNVNQRLRILFGSPCGLEIEEKGEKQVVALLTIPLCKYDRNLDEVNKIEQ